uniref:Uncharacterized protein n=1 Tax=Amphimedon queenslandica TaxID=400682 RepID=A0A1X7SZQ2_AMPQE
MEDEELLLPHLQMMSLTAMAFVAFLLLSLYYYTILVNFAILNILF